GWPDFAIYRLIGHPFCCTEDSGEGCKNFNIKFCCHQPEARLVASRFSRLFWGEQPPFTSIGRGGRYFFAGPPYRCYGVEGENLPLSSCSCSWSCSCSITALGKRTPNAQRPTLDVHITNLWSHLLAARVYTDRVDSRDHSRHHLFAR